MARIPKGEDPDYLAQAKLPENPFSFERTVKEAYLLEHDCTGLQAIAEKVGVSKGRVSQMFSSPESLKPETIQKLLAPIRSKELRRQIVRSWTAECFELDTDERLQGPFTGARVTSKTLRRIDRQIREFRLSTAAQTAFEAAQKCTNWSLRQAFLDRAYHSFQRLDRPGMAMLVCRMVAEDAEERDHAGRRVTAALYRLRLLPMLYPIDAGYVELTILQIEADSLGLRSNIESDFFVPTQDNIRRTILGVRLTLIEQGLKPADEVWLRSERERILRNALRNTAYQDRFRSYFFAARISFILGETFHASELLDQAFRQGDVKNLNALDACGVLQGRILAKTEGASTALAFLVAASEKVEQSQAQHLQRLIEMDIAHQLLGRVP